MTQATLEAIVFSLLGKKDGGSGESDIVQIDRIETQESTESGGANVVTVYLTNGKTHAFNVLNGAEGEALTVEKVEESEEDGGTNIYTLSDGSIINVKNGSTGSQGLPGKQGERGTNGLLAYYNEMTSEEKAQFDLDEVATSRREVAELRAALIHETESGEGAIAIDDSANIDADNLRVCGRSWQDGTPTPTAPVPIRNVVDDCISAGTKNLFNKSFFTMKTFENKSGTTLTRRAFVLCPSVNMWCMYVDGFLSKGAVNLYDFDVVNNKCTSDYTVIVQTNMKKQVKFSANHCYLIVLNAEADIDEVSTGLSLIISDNEPDAYPLGETDSVSLVGTTKPLVLRGVPDGAGGQIADWIDFDAGLVHRLIGAYTFNGDELWTTDNNNRVQTRMTSESGVFGRAKSGNPWTMSSLYESRSVYDNNRQMLVRWASSAFVVFSSAAKDASGNAITTETANSVATAGQSVQWQLANPFTEPLSDYGIDAHALRMSYPRTTIISGQGAGLEVEYIADTKRYIDKLHAGTMATMSEL